MEINKRFLDGNGATEHARLELNLIAQKALLDKEFKEQQNRDLYNTVRIATALLFLFFILVKCSPAWSDEVQTLTTFEASGEDTPSGGVGVYSDSYGKRIGTIERLGDGSTVMRGDFGRVIAKVEPRLSDDAPIRVTVRDRK